MAPRKTRTTAKARKNSPKTAKLEAFLEDFDSEVKTRVEQMKEKLNHLLKDVDNGYNMALIKLPKTVRQMPWMELFKSEKPEVANVSREEEAAIVESIVAENNPALFKSVKKATKKSTKSTSEDENTSGTTRKAKATRKPPTTSKRAKALTVRRSSRKPIVTPARNMDYSLMMGATPLITPRFDPRLPKTPAVRNPHHKERVYSISVNGSPIAAGHNEDIVINVPIGNGESVQLLASQMDSVDLSLLDETALRSIRQLKNRLTVLCGTE
ncbi:hypothetical protein CesoFtcFv8_019708 [Champsocephalus esox]|uniref:Borealin n=2 Tax=Champsocephalus TaxID=52236 RepID=A0AAN8CZB2_CHAGU|nr:hypothetical protein CesoFtcFv8_019708 [Champsocephalus esox]KAK5910980.1 hypothetical protein CgunFtcFv8_005194 [Champsocephalus gunnari]